MDKERVFSRRDVLLGGIGGLAAGLGLFGGKESAMAKELLAPVQYGFILDQTPARRAPDRPVIGNYRKGALVRYMPYDNDWVMVIQDSYRHYPGRALSHGDIFIPRQQIDVVTQQEIAPIPLSHPEERRTIDVNLTKQVLTAKRDNNVVWEGNVSTGLRSHETPTGNFKILRKRWARHMQGVDAGVPWDLPGVPFTQYFTNAGHAIHGCYWHNNYGRRMSHGCVNVPNDAAQLLYRLTLPAHTNFSQEQLITDNTATRVNIHY